jgi:soluble lytic murein transglycosylase-like protein
MAIADQISSSRISLEMAQDAGNYSPIAPASAVQSGLLAGNQVANQVKAISEEESANQFQQVLNQGYAGMVQAWKSMPPEQQVAVGDPTFAQKDEDSMAAWWAMVAKQQEKQARTTAVKGAASMVAQGDKVGAARTLTESGVVEPASGLSSMAKAQDEKKTEEVRAKIPEIFAKYAPKSSSTTIAGGVDLDSQLGRQFKITAKRLEPINPIIEKAAATHGIPANLIKAVISQESTGKNGLTSSAGAHGYMQLMPDTAKGLGVTDRANPEQNINGGAAYLAQQLEKFGDVEKAIAAYNAGPGTVDRLVKKYGDQWKENLPAETKDYIDKVPKYLAAYGGATFSSTQEGEDPKLFDIYKDAVAVDPNLPNDPTFKAGLDALDKDADNRRLNRADLAKEREATKKEAALQKRYELLDKKVAPKLQVARVMQDLDSIIPGGINGSEAIPGVGIGDGAIRKWLIGPTKDSRVGKIRGKIAELVNVTIKEQSGLAVTQSEGERIMQALNLTPTSTEEDFRYALRSKMKHLEQEYLEDLAGDPEARDLMLERVPDRTNPFKFGSKGPAAGGSGLTPEQRKARIAELRAKRGG